MKVVREYINEKFSKESDPVKDMGIGVPAAAFYEKCYEYAKNAESQGIFKSVSNIRWNSEETKKTFIDGVFASFSIESNHKTLVKTDVQKPIYGHTWESKNENFRVLLVKKEYNGEFVVHVYNVTNGKSYFPKKIAGFLAFTKGYKQLQVDEKFSAESDPIVDMGIGAINKIFEISKHFYSFKAEYYSEKEWKKIISWMLEEYEPWEVLACLNNRIMRDAYDNLSKYKRKATLNDFQNYNVRYMSQREESEMDRLLNNYRLFQTKWVEHYQDMAKEAGLFVEPMYEKFTDTSSDPIADMGIGGYSFETVSTGALIKVKPNYRSLISLTKNNSGQFSDIHGMRISHENCLVVSSVVNFSDGRKDIHIKKFPSEAMAREFRDNWAKDRIRTPWGGSNNRMIVSKLQFERRFEIIERGFNQVKESLNEKFVQDSDPISDLGIGMIDQIKKFVKSQGYNYNLDVALWICAQEGKTDYVQYLLDAGANVHVKNDYALRWASHNGHENVVKLLLDAGADVHARDDWALRWASANGHEKVVKLLQDHIAKEKRKQGKKVKESLNEKFMQDSDPIHDMGIGIKKVIIDNAKDMFKDAQHGVPICGGMWGAQYNDEDSDGFRIVEIRFDAFTAEVITNYLFAVKAAQEWLVDEFKTHELDEFFELETSITHSEGTDHIFWSIDFKEKYEMIFSMEDRIVINYKTINESLNEKFTEGGDPIRTLGIGLSNIIREKLGCKEVDALSDSTYVCYFNVSSASKARPVKFHLKEINDYYKQWIEHGMYQLGMPSKVIVLNNKMGQEIFAYQIKPEKLRESLNEKFTEEGDPVEQMGIGIRKVIDKYIKENDEGDVTNGFLSPLQFISAERLDPETKKSWCEFLLREGKEDLRNLEEEDIQGMIDVGVKFIPNSKTLPHHEFTYKIIDGKYFLFTEEWENFTNYFDYNNEEIDSEFVDAVLKGDASRYFDYYYGNQGLNEITDALSKEEEQKLFNYLKPLCLDYVDSEDLKNTNTIYDLFDQIKEDGNLTPIYNALLIAYSISLATTEEHEAWKDLTAAILKSLNIRKIDDTSTPLQFEISEEGLNKFFKSWYIKDEGIDYRPPQYGWGGDFNYEYFIEDFENNLKDN